MHSVVRAMRAIFTSFTPAPAIISKEGFTLLAARIMLSMTSRPSSALLLPPEVSTLVIPEI